MELDVVFQQGELPASAKEAVAEGFTSHSNDLDAPPYAKERVNWTLSGPQDSTLGVLTGDLLWDWLYIDELWVSETLRGQGYGRRLMHLAEEFAAKNQQAGIWLWTQSWQAEGFYRQLDYVEFTRFENFPRGYARIGFRKFLAPDRRTQ